MIIWELHIFSKSSQHKWVSWKRTAPYIAYKIIQRIDLILDTQATEYTWQAFLPNACIMVIIV